MAKIHIENGIISSSADYSLFHGTSPLATIEPGGFRVQGDIIAENMIVSSSTTYITTSFSDGSTQFGDSDADTHHFHGIISSSVGGSTNNNSVIRATGGGARLLLDSVHNETTTGIQFLEGAFGTEASINYDHSSDKMQFKGSGTNTTLMTLDTNGRLGIGDTSPDAPLDIEAGVDPLLILNKTGGNNSAIHFQHAGTAKGYIYVGDDELMRFGNPTTNPTLAIDANGRVGIGTINPGGVIGEAMLDISETGTNSDARIVSRTTAVTGSFGAAQGANRFFTSGAGLAIITNSNHPIQFATNVSAGSATEDVIIDTNGRVGIGTTSPQKLLHLHQANSNTLFEAVHIRTNSSGEGLALGVNADNSSYVVNSDSGNALHLGGSSSTINSTGHLTVDGGGNIGIGTASPGSLLTIKDTGDISTATFISGITGDGFRILDAGSDGVSMEIDNIIVRNTLRTHIFQKDVVKATNGILFISDSGVISGSSNSAGTVTFENSKSATFNDNDILLFKDVPDSGSQVVTAVRFQINGSGTSDGGHTTYNVDNVSGNLDNLNVGGTAARINGGTVTIDASSNNSPFIDVNASSGSAVLRMGNLAGITSPVFGSLSGKGFGIWASGSAYFEGKINATAGGVIAGWDLNDDTIEKVDSNGGVKIDSTNKRIDFLSNASTTRLRVGQVDSNKFGIRGFNDNAQRVFEISETRNEIAGWEITPGNIQSDNTGGSVALSATSQSLQIFTGSIDFARPKVVVGDLPTSGDASTKRYGFGVFTGTVDADITNDLTYNVLITRDKAKLAGWDLVPGNIQSDNTFGSVRLSSISQSLTIWTGSVNEAQPKLVLGKLPLHDGTVDSPYGFAVFSGTGTVSGSEASASVLITANKARLAGWELVPGRLKSGTVADINGNQGSIALGTGATTATGTPTDGLFFVSASTQPVFYVGSNFSYVNDTLTAAGWTIGTNSIAKSTDVVIDSNAKSITLGNGSVAIENNSGTPQIRSATNFTSGNGFFLSSAGTDNFRVGNAGAARLQFDGTNFEIYNSSDTKLVSLGASNTIAGWSITSARLSAGNIKIDSGGFIEASSGGFSNVNDIGDTSTGFLVNNDGEVLIKQGGANSNFIRFASGVLDIRTGTAIMSGSSITLETPKFFLGKKGSQFVSGSNNLIEISSSKFHLKNDGDVIMNNITASNANVSGKMTATSGNIGGFVIGSTNLRGLRSGTEKFRLELETADELMIDDRPSFGLSLGGDASSGHQAESDTGIPIVMAHSDTGRTVFRVGDTTNFLKFDSGGTFTLQNSGTTTISGSAVNIQTPKFFLGDEGNAFVSGSEGNVEISSSNFHLTADGAVSASGDITADTGIFKNVTIAGKLITPARTGSAGYSSGVTAGNPLTVESWFPTGNRNLAGDTQLKPLGSNPLVISGSADDLQLSVWGWTVSGKNQTGGAINPANVTCVWSCTDKIGSYSTISPSSTVDQGPSNPPSALFKFVSETDGTQNYDAVTVSNLFNGDAASELGKGPKMALVDEGDGTAFYYTETGGNDAHILLTSEALKIPVSGSEDVGLREVMLEYAVRPMGAFGGFQPTYSTRILDASDSSVLFQTATGGNSEDGTAQKWQIISFPIVSSAGLITFPTAAGNKVSTIDEIKIQIEIRATNSGGGQPHGHLFTEMRLRELPFANGLTANAINTNLLGTYLKSQSTNFITALQPIHIGPNPADDVEGSTLAETLTKLNKGEIELWKVSGDPSIQFRISSTDKFTIGVDDSDGDKFKITSGGTLSDTGDFEMDGSGNVQIAGDVIIGGETTIDANLHLYTASSGLTNLKFESNGSAAWRLGIPASQTYFAFDNANDNLSAPKVVIDANGQIGIGTTSPQVGLDIHADTTETVAVFGQADDGAAYIATRVGEVQDRPMGYIFQVGSTAAVGYGSANTTATIISQVKNDGGALQGNLIFSTNGGDSLSQEMIIEADGDITMAHDLDVSGDLTAATITMTGKIDTSGEVEAEHLHSTDDIEVGSDIFHSSDTDTKIAFTSDRIDIDAGGVPMIDIVEDGASSYIAINQDANDVNFRVESSGETNMIKVDGGNDFMGIGTGTQDSVSLPRLTIEQDTANYVLTLRNTYTAHDSADGLMLRYSRTADMDANAHFFQVLDGDDDIQYELRGNNAGGFSEGSSFTAGHDTACEDYDDMLPGMILESTGEMWYKPIDKTMETALPFTKLSDTNGSSTVFGVVSGTLVKYDATGSISNVPIKEQRYIKNGWCLKPSFPRYARNAPTGSGNIHLNTMSIGEGVVWVTNINGEISNGDFIESSVIKGYGRKQDDDILRSKTVAKCTETINWSEITSSIQYSGSAYKKYLAAATFHCG